MLSAGMNGQKFSGPNDIAIAADDAVYLADNDFGLRDGGRNPDKQLQNGIYRIKDGQTTLVLSGADLGGIPNGIALSPDGKWMYLSTAGRKMRRYAVNPDGTSAHLPSSRKASASATARRPTPRGMSTRQAAPARHRSHHVARGQAARHDQPADLRRRTQEANLRDERSVRRSDGKTLFIAGCDAVFTIRLKTSGIVPANDVKR